jgi:hypothetical protein
MYIAASPLRFLRSHIFRPQTSIDVGKSKIIDRHSQRKRIEGNLKKFPQTQNQTPIKDETSGSEKPERQRVQNATCNTTQSSEFYYASLDIL